MEKDVESIEPGPGVVSCSLYGVRRCGGDKGVLFIDRDIEFEHIARVESLICALDRDERMQ